MSAQTHDDRDLEERLRSLRVDLPDDGFEAALHRKLAAAGAPDEPSVWRRLAPRHRVLWPAFGAAAGIAAFLLLGVLRPSSPDTPRELASDVARLPTQKVAVVRFNLSVDVAVQDADIRVSLPDGLVFWAEGQELAQRSFEWAQPLQKGDNDIPIAVRGLKPGRYRVMVSANVGGQPVRHDVELEVVEG